MTAVVYYEMSSGLKFKQMGLGSIHNFPDLGKVIVTEGKLSTCQLPGPNSSFGLGTVDVIFFTGDPVQFVPDDGGERWSQGSPFSGGDIEIPGH
jgi:hypothetical protein